MNNLITQETLNTTLKALASNYKLNSNEQVKTQAIVEICDYMAIFWHLATDDNIKSLFLIELYKEVVYNNITSQELQLSWKAIKYKTESKYLKGILPPEEFIKEALIVRKNNELIAWKEFNKNEAIRKIKEDQEEDEKLAREKKEHKYKMENDIEYRKREEEMQSKIKNILKKYS